MCFISVYLYHKFAVEKNKDLTEYLWLVVGVLSVFSALCFVIFLLLINRTYWWTFFSFLTGKQFVVANYHEAETDEMRFVIFGHHRSFYRAIELELREFLIANWDKWKDEKPEWFDALAISGVPVDMLPPVVLQKLGGVDGARESIRKSVVVEKKRRQSMNEINKVAKVGSFALSSGNAGKGPRASIRNSIFIGPAAREGSMRGRGGGGIGLAARNNTMRGKGSTVVPSG